MSIPSIVLTMDDLRSFSEGTYREIIARITERGAVPVPDAGEGIQAPKRCRSKPVTRETVLDRIRAGRTKGMTSSGLLEHFATPGMRGEELASLKHRIRNTLSNLRVSGDVVSRPLAVSTGQGDKVSWHLKEEEG